MLKQHFLSFKIFTYLQRLFSIDRFPPPEEIFQRHSLIPGWNQDKIRSLKILSVGAGALGGWFSRAMVRMGPRQIDILDFDRVEASNLPRQPFSLQDLGRPKAFQLREHLYEEQTNSLTEINAYPYSLEQAVGLGLSMDYDMVYVGVDSDPTRVFAARLFVKYKVPVIFAGTGKNSQKGYIFIQKGLPDTPCLVCMNPSILNSEVKAGCYGAAADVPFVLAGIATYAFEALVMDRQINWNYWQINLPTGKSIATRVHRKELCPVCSAIE